MQYEGAGWIKIFKRKFSSLFNFKKIVCNWSVKTQKKQYNRSKRTLNSYKQVFFTKFLQHGSCKVFLIKDEYCMLITMWKWLGPLEVIQLYEMKCKNKQRHRDCYFGVSIEYVRVHGWALDVARFHLS